MNELSYAQINTKSLTENLTYIKKHYSFPHIILNVSNNAFHHGMYLIHYLQDTVDYLYTSNFQDVLLIRKYNQEIKIIYSGLITENNAYDLILNNVILLIKNEDTIDLLLNLNIKDKFEIIFNIDKEEYNGIHSKHVLSDILDKIKNDVHIHIKGVQAEIKEKDYFDFQYIISPLKNLELVILNHEKDKTKIKLSNAIKLDASIYGIDTVKKGIFKKEIFPFKPILEIKSHLTKIVVKRSGKKETFIGVIPFGFNQGLSSSISKVYIKNKLYSIKEIYSEFALVLIDASIHVDDLVEIVGQHNPLQTLCDIFLLTCNLSIVYDDYTLDKNLVY